MADIIHITDEPVRESTGAGGTKKQELRLAQQVEGYDALDLLLTVYEDSGGSGISVKLITGMQNETEEGWVDLGTFRTTGAQSASKQSFEGMLRYVRYELMTSSVNATFLIHGVGRRWA